MYSPTAAVTINFSTPSSWRAGICTDRLFAQRKQLQCCRWIIYLKSVDRWTDTGSRDAFVKMGPPLQHQRNICHVQIVTALFVFQGGVVLDKLYYLVAHNLDAVQSAEKNFGFGVWVTTIQHLGGNSFQGTQPSKLCHFVILTIKTSNTPMRQHLWESLLTVALTLL